MRAWQCSLASRPYSSSPTSNDQSPTTTTSSASTATSSVIHPTSRRRERDEAMILLALCGDPAKIVPNWRIANKICNAYILRGVGRRGTRDVVD